MTTPLLDALHAARNNADRAADELASELRMRVLAGLVQLEHDDPAMTALDAWNRLDVERGILEQAVERERAEQLAPAVDPEHHDERYAPELFA